jgi:hypothetical protein
VDAKAQAAIGLLPRASSYLAAWVAYVKYECNQHLGTKLPDHGAQDEGWRGAKASILKSRLHTVLPAAAGAQARQARRSEVPAPIQQGLSRLRQPPEVVCLLELPLALRR